MRWWWQAQLWVHAVWPARRILPGRGPVRWVRLPKVLLADPASLGDGDLRVHVAARMAVGVRGAALLLRRGRKARSWRQGLGDGLVQYELPGWPDPFWVDVGPESARGGWGPPPRDFSARVRFSDVRQAVMAQEKSLDIPAEVGAGRLQIDGRFPLVEGLDEAMRKAAEILEGP